MRQLLAGVIILLTLTGCQAVQGVGPYSDSRCEREARHVIQRVAELEHEFNAAFFVGDRKRMVEIEKEGRELQEWANILDEKCPADLMRRISQE